MTDRAGVGDTGYGLGVAVGDYDNDGHPDVYVNNYGPNLLYRNNGDGTFTDVARQAGVTRGSTVGAGANFLDIDGDGDLDLFVSNYVVFRYETFVPIFFHGVPAYHGPRDYPHQPNHLFRNNGDGTFADVSKESGIGAHPGPGMGTICFDYDDDGDTDIFVCNDTTGNFLFQNDGKGNFREVGLDAGVACNLSGTTVGSMGVDCGDYDRDGLPDLFITDYHTEMPILFKNLGSGLFEDATLRTGAHGGVLYNVKWGCAFVDFDNDGNPDIFFVCGHVQDNIHLIDKRSSYLASPVLLRNTGDGRFVNVSDSSGDLARVQAVGRGAAFDDLDNDGDVDAVILSARHPPVVLRNDSAPGNHWLQIRVRGVKTNRDGVGARVKVVAGDLVQSAEVHSGRGYQSHFGSRLHFGLGKRDRVDRIEVRWLGGGTETFDCPGVDRLITLAEGGGKAAPGNRPAEPRQPAAARGLTVDPGKGGSP